MSYRKDRILIGLIICTMLFLAACKNDTSILNVSDSISNDYSGKVMYSYNTGTGIVNIPVRGAKVSLSTSTQSYTQFTDYAGIFTYNKNDLSDIVYTLKIDTGYFNEYRKEINPEDIEGTQVYYVTKSDEAIDSSAFIGKIVINGNSASDINVRFGVNSINTDNKGYFVFDGLSQSVYDFRTKQNLGFSDVNKKITIDGDYIWVNNIVELLKPQISFGGRVYDYATSQILTGVDIQISMLSDFYYYNNKVTTDENGEFYLSGLVSGNYSFIYEKDNYITGSIEVDISDSTERDKLKSLKLKKMNGDLQLTILDSNTELPVRNVKVKVDNNSSEYITDINGRVYINDISMESHDISIYSYLYDTYETNVVMQSIFQSDTYEIVYKERAGVIRGKVYTDDEGTISALNISSDERELRAFSVYSVVNGQKRLTEFRPVKWIDDNEFIIQDLPSGIYQLGANFIVTQAQETEFRSAGNYSLYLPDFILPLNTGDELRIVVNLKKSTGE